MTPATLVTERLLMRPWREEDREPFAAMCADREVMRHFPALLDRAAGDALAARLAEAIERDGYGLWALELRETGEFAGFTGLQPMPDWSAGAGHLEIAWRLRRRSWGLGLATEAAREARSFAFGELGRAQIWSLTAANNARSIAVMARLGLTLVGRVDHPSLDAGHELRPHVLYRGTRARHGRQA